MCACSFFQCLDLSRLYRSITRLHNAAVESKIKLSSEARTEKKYRRKNRKDLGEFIRRKFGLEKVGIEAKFYLRKLDLRILNFRKFKFEEDLNLKKFEFDKI